MFNQTEQRNITVLTLSAGACSSLARGLEICVSMLRQQQLFVSSSLVEELRYKAIELSNTLTEAANAVWKSKE